MPLSADDPCPHGDHTRFLLVADRFWPALSSGLAKKGTGFFDNQANVWLRIPMKPWICLTPGPLS